MNEYKCIHEELIQNHSLEIKGLEARADYKDARLDEVDKRLERMEDKIDNLAEAVNQLHLESLQDDIYCVSFVKSRKNSHKSLHSVLLI